MSLNKKSNKPCWLLSLTAATFCSCQVSDQWAPSAFSTQSMNHNLSRPAPFIPVANPVPAPQRVSVAAVGGGSSWGGPSVSNRSQTTATAVRQTQPTWPQPVVASYNPPAQVPQRVRTVLPTAPQISQTTPPVSRPIPPISHPTPPVSRPQTSAPAVRGKVRLVNGLAIAPPDAPAVVRRAVAAGNRMQKMPYKWGGGHAKLNDNGYDCSGTVSYVLRESGLMKDQMTSRGFFNYGEAGKGDWITVWTKDGHVFMDVGGLRLDTGGSSRRTGPRWKTNKRSYKGFKPRHPRGL